MKNTQETYRLKEDIKRIEKVFTNGEWVEFDSDYYISNSGKVYSTRLEWKAFINGGMYELSQKITPKGYKEVSLYKTLPSGQIVRKTIRTHKLVLQHFVPKGENEMMLLECNHKNGIKSDNTLQNLEWITRSENIKHSYWHLNRSKRIRPIWFDGKKYNSIVDCAKENGLCQTSINVVLSRGQKTFMGKPISYAGKLRLGNTNWEKDLK